MARTLGALPSKRQFYNKLNDFILEAYKNMISGIPAANAHVYTNSHGGKLKRRDTGNFVGPNSGRLLGSLPQPGRIHMRGLGNGAAKAGKIVFVVNENQLYDPVNKEKYWNKIAYDVHTMFGPDNNPNINRHREFWKNAAKQLVGMLQTYAAETATYKPAWMGRFTDEQEAEMEKEMDILFMSLAQQADEEGII